MITDHSKAKSVNTNVVATMSHNEYKDAVLNEKYLRHSINRIQSEDHTTGTYEISLPCFYEKIFIQNQWI